MSLFSPQIALKKVVPLCRQLATSHDAGLPILRSLELVSQNQRDPQIKRVLTEMNDSIRHGSTLGEAARAQKKYLPPFFIELLATGEHGGKLDVMLRDLAQYFEDRLNMQRSIVRSMILPIVQLLAAWYIGLFALGLVSRLPALFNQRGGGTFDIMGYIEEYLRFQAIATGIFVGIFLVCVGLGRFGTFGYAWGLLATHVWPLSRVTKAFALARFFRSMSLLIGSGMRIDHCVINSASVTANPYMEKQLVQAVPYIRDGHTLVESFAPIRVISPQGREMINVGEQSGQLELALRKVAEYHQEEAMHAVAVATKVFGVAIVLAVACLIGYVVITFWLTYFQMIEGVMNDL